MKRIYTLLLILVCGFGFKSFANPSPCNPEFSVQYLSGNTVKFIPIHHNDSLNSYAHWDFGDGNTASAPNINLSPTHTYAAGGSYLVKHKVWRVNPNGVLVCIDSFSKTVIIQMPCNLVANFEISQLTSPPLSYHFQNTSTPLHNTDSIRWTFGDGTSSSQVHPDHTYASAGTYHVCLRIQKRNAAGQPTNCVKEICKTLTIPATCNIEPRWSAQPDAANPRKIHFTNLTIVPNLNATATWTFGDGTSANSWNAFHEYAQPGRYYVCLKIQTSPNCIRIKCDSITVHAPVPPCTQLSKFRYEKFIGDNQKYKFIPDHISNAVHYTWTFGDGTGSQDPIAIHRYAQPGTYIACLTAWRGPNCASTTCKEIKVLPQINCDSIQVGFNYQRDPLIPNKVYFYVSENFPVLSQTWTITKLPSHPPVVLYQNNPVYVFRDTGYYKVCLRAITLGGCVKEICKVIRIEQVATNICELQAFPNPAHNLVNVNVHLTAPEMIHAYIYNSANLMVRQKHQQGNTGNNLVTIEVAGLVSGLYTIKLVYANKICYARFTKL